MYLSIIKPIKHATIETPNIKSTTKMNNIIDNTKNELNM